MNRGNFSQKTLARHLIQLVVIPPRFGNVPVGDDPSGIAHREPRAEYVHLHFGAVAPDSEYRIAVAILQRLALLVQAGVAQPLAVLLIPKCDRNMQQTNALHVVPNQVLRGIAFLLNSLQAGIRIVQLFLQRGSLVGTGVRHLGL